MAHTDQRAEALPLGVVAEPLLHPPGRLRLSRGSAAAIATVGRFGAIWLPSFAFISPHVDRLSVSVPVSATVALVWFAALHVAFAAGRLTRLALGAPVAAAVGTATGLVGVAALHAWIPALQLDGRMLLLLSAGVFVSSAAWEALVVTSAPLRQRVLVVGAGDGGSDLIAELRAMEETPFEVIGIVDDELETTPGGDVPVHGCVADLAEIVRAQKPDLVVLAVGSNRPAAFSQLLEVAGSGFKVVGLPEFYEHAFGRVPVKAVTAAWFMSVLHLYQRPYTQAAKRAFDVAVASVGLLLVAPILPVLAFLVSRTPGPIVFRQVRLGEGGRHFTIYKFRTMRQDAEAAGAPIWASERDPRITTTGRIMRKTRLDELPQLWNVLRGDMSIVGPRPERPEFMQLLEETVPFWTRRHLVKPGITGWAQVRRGYTADAEGTADKLAYDLWYLRHRSLVVDLAICVKTFTTLVTGAGAR